MHVNHRDIWKDRLPWPPAVDGHKYDRGHVVMAGGAMMTGAIRLAAQAAMRIGAGLCTIAAPERLMGIYTADAPHLLFEPLDSIKGFPKFIMDGRRNAALIGPGFGLAEPKSMRRAVLETLALEKPCVLDADALNAFAGMGETLAAALHSQSVITPHEGEFARLFPDLKGDRLTRIRGASTFSRGVMVLKGSETLVIQAGREPVINGHASSWLATAGAGDVLSGMIAGLLAQGVPAFEAACAAVWIHGDAGRRCGPGLVAPDIINALPSVMRDFA